MKKKSQGGSMERTFKELYLAGEIDFEEIDDYSRKWGFSDSESKLGEYLGFNEEEEDAWVSDGEEALIRLLDAQKNKILKTRDLKRETYGRKMIMEKLVTVNSKIEAEMMIGMLESNGIKAFSDSNGAGEYLNITANYSTLGENVYVNEQDLKQAKEIIQAFEEDSQDNQDEQDSELNQEQVNKTRRIGAIAAGVILGLFALGFIYSICQSILF